MLHGAGIHFPTFKNHPVFSGQYTSTMVCIYGYVFPNPLPPMELSRRSAPRLETGERALSDASGRFAGEGHRLWPAPLTEMACDFRNHFGK